MDKVTLIALQELFTTATRIHTVRTPDKLWLKVYSDWSQFVSSPNGCYLISSIHVYLGESQIHSFAGDYYFQIGTRGLQLRNVSTALSFHTYTWSSIMRVPNE